MKVRSIYGIFILFALFSLFFPETGFAINDRETSAYQRANVYYEQGNFDEAIKQYNIILDSGFESGSLYYNLGNCYFKKGELGRALLNYEKARRLIPLDKDLESNYEYACSLIKNGAVSPGRGLAPKVFDNFFDKFTVDGLTILLSALYVLILISVLISLFFRPFKKQALILAVFAGLFFIGVFAGLTGKIALLDKEAIVIAERADAKFEPMDKATTHFTVYEGMKIEVTASKGNWYKVRRHDNKSGWLQQDNLIVF